MDTASLRDLTGTNDRITYRQHGREITVRNCGKLHGHAFVQSEHEDVGNRDITTSLPTATEINCRGRARLFPRMDVYRVYWLAGNARSETRIAHRVIGQFYFEFLRTGTGTGMNEP